MGPPSVDFSMDCVDLAKKLLGQVVCRRTQQGILKGMVVETEAYVGPHDKACHSYGGRHTARNEAMYMKPGTCYVYTIYGMYQCFNISSREDGAGVLIRALEPLQNIDLMRRHRSGYRDRYRRNAKISAKAEQKMRDTAVANGPSKLCIAMAITKSEINKEDILASSKIWLEGGRDVGEAEIAKSKRVGINNAGIWGEKLLRFYIKSSPFVSNARR